MLRERFFVVVVAVFKVKVTSKFILVLSEDWIALFRFTVMVQRVFERFSILYFLCH